jgi:transposase
VAQGAFRRRDHQPPSGGAYVEGARPGDPDAVQVADRWHFLQNLAQVLEGVLIRKHRAVREATQAAVTPAAPPPSELPVEERAAAPTPSEDPREVGTPRFQTWASRAAREKAVRRDRRHERYRSGRTASSGRKRRQIVAAVGMSRETARRYLEAGTFPEIARRRNTASIGGYLPYLHRRWQEGCHNATVLWEEIVAQGFTGSTLSVYRATAL